MTNKNKPQDQDIDAQDIFIAWTAIRLVLPVILLFLVEYLISLFGKYPMTCTIVLSGVLVVVAFFVIRIAENLRKYSHKITVVLLIIIMILIIIIYAQAYKQMNEIIPSGNNTPSLECFGDYFYFSVVTFTTLGYGDYRPGNDSRFLAASEALIGYLYLGVFVALVYDCLVSKENNALNNKRLKETDSDVT